HGAPSRNCAARKLSLSGARRSLKSARANGLRLRNRTSVSPLSIGRADSESGSLMSSLTCSVTKLTHIMKNISSCSTTSSSGVRLGSALLPSAVGPWIMASASLGLFSGGSKIRAVLRTAVKRESLLLPRRHSPAVGRRGDRLRHRRDGGLLRVVIHLRQQVVGNVGGVHGQADEAVAEEGVAEDGRHRQGDAQERHDQGVRD